MERVITYIDGFNLYFGMMDAGLGDSRWLNVQALDQQLLKPGQQLAGTKYFTARISGPPDKRKRQVTYLEALRACLKTRNSSGNLVQSGHEQTNTL